MYKGWNSSDGSSYCMTSGNKKRQIESLKQFFYDSKKLIVKCEKPNRKEFQKIWLTCVGGFAIINVIGYVVKLMFR